MSPAQDTLHNAYCSGGGSDDHSLFQTLKCVSINYGAGRKSSSPAERPGTPKSRMLKP